MKNTKRIISLLLCVLMVLSVIPVTAFAATPIATVVIGNTEYKLEDSIAITPEDCTGTVTAKYAGSQTRITLENLDCPYSFEIKAVGKSGYPLCIFYKGKNTVAVTDTTFPYAQGTPKKFAAISVTATVGSTLIQGEDADSVLNVKYQQPNAATSTDLHPKDGFAVYTGIYTSGSVTFCGHGTVNVDVKTQISEGGNNTGDGDGCISTVGIYTDGSFGFNKSLSTDASTLNVLVNAVEAPGKDNYGYVRGIKANSMYLSGFGTLNVKTESADAISGSDIMDIEIASKTIKFIGNDFEPDKFFRGSLNLTTSCEYAKLKNSDTIYTFSTSAASKDYKIDTSDAKALSITYMPEETMTIAIGGSGLYQNLPVSFTATQAYDGVSNFTVLPDACYVLDYSEDMLAEEPVMSFDGNKMTVTVTTVSDDQGYGNLEDAFTIRIAGYDTKNTNKLYLFDETFNLTVQECIIKEYYENFYKVGSDCTYSQSNYDPYDDFYEDPLGYYDVMDGSITVTYPDRNQNCDAYLLNNKVAFTTNADFLTNTGLKLTNLNSSQFEGVVQYTQFSLMGKLEKSGLDEVFYYADFDKNDTRCPTVYKVHFITYVNDIAYKGYLVKGTEANESVAAGRNALRAKVIYTNAGEFGLTATGTGSTAWYVTLKGTPTKRGTVRIVYEITKRTLTQVTKAQYYAEYVVLENEPIEREHYSAKVGVAFEGNHANPSGSIRKAASTLDETGLRGTYSVSGTKIYGTPTKTGEYYFITEVYLSGTKTYEYYKDNVTVTDDCKHTGETEIKNKVDATCGKAGYTGDTYCKACGVKIAEGSVINATGKHIFTGEVKSNGDGTHSYKCTGCEAYGGAKSCLWDKGTVTKAATATEEGVITYTCTVCKGTKTEKIEKLKEDDFIPGDVDGDGSVKAADARLALRASVGLTGDKDNDGKALNFKDTTSREFKAANVDDSDEKITAADARLILRASVGLETLGKK